MTYRKFACALFVVLALAATQAFALVPPPCGSVGPLDTTCILKAYASYGPKQQNWDTTLNLSQAHKSGWYLTGVEMYYQGEIASATAEFTNPKTVPKEVFSWSMWALLDLTVDDNYGGCWVPGPGCPLGDEVVSPLEIVATAASLNTPHTVPAHATWDDTAGVLNSDDATIYFSALGYFAGYGTVPFPAHSNAVFNTSMQLGLNAAGDSSSNVNIEMVYTMEKSKTPPIPEPQTLLLLGSGLVGFATYLRRRRA